MGARGAWRPSQLRAVMRLALARHAGSGAHLSSARCRGHVCYRPDLSPVPPCSRTTSLPTQIPPLPRSGPVHGARGAACVCTDRRQAHPTHTAHAPHLRRHRRWERHRSGLLAPIIARRRRACATRAAPIAAVVGVRLSGLGRTTSKRLPHPPSAVALTSPLSPPLPAACPNDSRGSFVLPCSSQRLRCQR